MSKVTYADAGVDIEAGNEVVRRIKSSVQKTFSNHVIGGLGGFGAMYDLKSALADYDHPVMVQSIDGVGTKTIVARMAGQYGNLGHDLLSACANDILVLGAKTLTMLDYIANDKLNPDTVEKIVLGMAEACQQNGVSLVGGETAEMPDTYLPGEHDLVGIVTGVIDKNNIIDGSTIEPGYLVYGLASSGLHTNGFSLARKLMFEVGGYGINDWLAPLKQTVAEALLAPHINYSQVVHAVLDAEVKIAGMAHITGGGLIENLPRVLPQGCAVDVALDSWPEPPLFALLKKLGQIPVEEAYRAFNMGIGWVMIIAPDQATKLESILQHHGNMAYYRIGHIIASQSKQVNLR